MYINDDVCNDISYTTYTVYNNIYSIILIIRRLNVGGVKRLIPPTLSSAPIIAKEIHYLVVEIVQYMHQG